MLDLLRRILLTLIALAALVVVEQAFGMTTAIVVAGIGFIVYLLLLTMRQMRDEDEDEKT